MPEKTGISTSIFGSGISRVPIKLSVLSVPRPVDVMGGFFGVGQDASTNALYPMISWAVVERPPERPKPPRPEFPPMDDAVMENVEQENGPLMDTRDRRP